MYTSEFFGTKLGQASLASIAAMACVIALTTQFQPSASAFAAHGDITPVVEMA